MLPAYREELGATLPDQMHYPYFADREAAWLLAHALRGPTRIAAIRKGPLGAFLNRPAIRAVTARCGDGRLDPAHLLPLADPMTAFDPATDLAAHTATEAAYEALVAEEIRWFTVSFDFWGAEPNDDRPGVWRDLQVSRPGSNLVLQVNFPEAYLRDFALTFTPEMRRNFECASHPIRTDGAFTMAWARLDIDADRGEMLIEEIQSDWLRLLATRGRMIARNNGSNAGKAIAHAHIDLALDAYGRDWARVTLLAALAFAVSELGIRRIWIHQPQPGAKLKNIEGPLPPRSLYSDLPRRFGFQPTHRAPSFLYDHRHHVLGRMRRKGRPLFWHLDLAAPGPSTGKRQEC